MKWISKAKYIEESGLSNGVLRGWFDRHLHRGVHYQVIGHTTMINVELVDEWITQQVSDHKVKVCGSESTAKVRSHTLKHSPEIVALDTSRQL